MQFDMAHLWSSMGWVAKGVVFTLTIMSIWSISIIFDRWKLYSSAKAQSRKYAADVARLLKAGKLKEAVDLSGSVGHEVLPSGQGIPRRLAGMAVPGRHG